MSYENLQLLGVAIASFGTALLFISVSDTSIRYIIAFVGPGGLVDNWRNIPQVRYQIT